MIIALLLWATAALLTACSAKSTSGSLTRVGSVRALDYHSLAFSPADRNTLFFGHHNGIMKSQDGGKTWSPIVDQSGFDAMNLVLNRTQPQVLWMAGHNVFYRSTDGGASWDAVPAQLPGLDLHAFAMSPSDPNTLYAYAVGFTIFKSTDGGITWEGVPFPFRTVVTSLAVGGNPETLYVGTLDGLTGTSDGGQTFAQPRSVNGTAPINAVSAAPGRPILYVGTDRGLSRSDDGGASWNPVEFGGRVAAIAVDPTDPGRVALVDTQGGIFKSPA